MKTFFLFLLVYEHDEYSSQIKKKKKNLTISLISIVLRLILTIGYKKKLKMRKLIQRACIDTKLKDKQEGQGKIVAEEETHSAYLF